MMSARKPTDLTIAATARYLGEYLLADSRILDAGCGAGELALKLKEAGHRVTALDVETEEVEKARALGVETKQVNFLHFQEGSFDAIVFSFSLHHIFPLDEAVEHAERLLVPGGLLLAEEFAWDEIDESTARWFYEMWSLLETCGVLSEEYSAGGEHHGDHAHGDHAHGATPATPQTPLDEWMTEHHHEPPLHKGKEMLGGVEQRFDLVNSERVPTLFADFAVALEPSQRGYDVAFKLLELERSLIDDEAIVPLGLRMVAKKKG
jgi:SAM-dependent methyltransferase